MTIALRGSVTGGQSASAQATAFGSGWQPDDYQVYVLAVKNGADSVSALLAGYDDIETYTAGGGGGLVRRICGRPLQSGDTPPTLPANSAVQYYLSATFSGVLIDTTANIIAATTPAHTSNSSSTAINYLTNGTPTDNNAAVILFGSYNSSDPSPVFGMPSGFSGSAVNLADITGSNMRGALWMDLQTTAANIPAGTISISGGTLQTNRTGIFTLRARPAMVSGAGRHLMMMGCG